MTILAKSPYRGAARPHSLYFAAEKVADRAVSYLYGSYSGDMWGSALEYAQDRAALVECGRAAADAGSRRAVRMRVRDLWRAVHAAFMDAYGLPDKRPYADCITISVNQLELLEDFWSLTDGAYFNRPAGQWADVPNKRPRRMAG